MLAFAGLFAAIQTVRIGDPVALAHFDAAPLMRPLILIHMLKFDPQDVEAQPGSPGAARAARALEAQVAIRVVVMWLVGRVAHVLVKELPKRAGHILELLLLGEVTRGRDNLECLGVGLLELRLGHVLAVVVVALELGHLYWLEPALFDGDVEDAVHVVLARKRYGGLSRFEHGERKDAVFELKFHTRFIVAFLGNLVAKRRLAYLVDVGCELCGLCLAGVVSGRVRGRVCGAAVSCGVVAVTVICGVGTNR